MHRKKKTLISAVGIAGLILASTAPAMASNSQQSRSSQPSTHAESPANLTRLVARDLGITKEKATELVQIETKANRIEKKFEKRLRSNYAGTWVDTDSTDSVEVTVATTDASQADEIWASGARAEVVEHNLTKLNRAKDKLDDVQRPSADAVTGWYSSPQNNAVVVLVRPDGKTEAAEFVERAGVDKSLVDTVRTRHAPRPLYDVRGGDAFYGPRGRCSVGFSVERGFVTAGHCGNAGGATYGHNRVAQGQVEESVFPGNDMGWVQVNNDWTPQPLVNRYDGSTVSVAGGIEAAIGAAVCRSGSTTGWHCGEIVAKDQTVNYPQGTVHRMTQTTVCAEPGDSGGPYITPEGRQAQGITSGGYGDCTSGGTTYFQPVQPILSTYDLFLVTEGEGCGGLPETHTGSLASKAEVYEPNGTGWENDNSGTYRGCLAGPAGTDFDLYLLKWDGSDWRRVARGTSPGSQERVSYDGTPGYYVWRVFSYSGNGEYTFSMNRP